MEIIVTRAGISPTNNDIRIAGLRTHLYAYAFARNNVLSGGEGKFILRWDDSNASIHNVDNIKPILKILTQDLGMSIDKETVIQSLRTHVYERYLQKLTVQGLTYFIIKNNTKATYFDTVAFKNIYQKDLVSEKIISVFDVVLGKERYFDIETDMQPTDKRNEKKNPRDFPITRGDGTFLFHLCSTVDDFLLGTTHIVRGNDKITVTLFQEMLRIAFGFPKIKYAFTPLLLDDNGKRLRTYSSIGETYWGNFIKNGFFREALLSYILTSGYGNPDVIYKSLDDFCKSFKSTKIRQHDGKFDLAKLRTANRKVCNMIADEKYIESIRYYLELNNENHLLENMTNDLNEILLKYRRVPEEARNITISLLKPKYSVALVELTPFIKQLVTYLKRSNQNYQKQILELNSYRRIIGDSIFHSAIRWVLTGSVSGIDYKDTLKYLKSSNLLGKRVTTAENKLKETV